MSNFAATIAPGENEVWEFTEEGAVRLVIDGDAQPFEIDIETKRQDQPDAAYARIPPLVEFGTITVSSRAEKTFDTEEVERHIRVTVTNNSGTRLSIDGRLSQANVATYLREDDTIYHWPNSRANEISGAVTGGVTLGGVGQPQQDLVYADDGNYYTTVQAAVDAAAGYARAGPGTYEEDVTVTTAGFQLQGAGRGTVIDGGSDGPAVTVDAENVTVEDMICQTDTGGNQDAVAITANGDGAEIKDIEGIEAGSTGISSPAGAEEVVVRSCRIDNSDERAIDLEGPESRVEGCYALSSADDGIRVVGVESAVTHSFSLDHGNDGIEIEGDESRAVGNTVDNVADNGLLIQGNDCVANSNIVTNNGGDGIVVQGSDDVIVGNRSGGNTDADLNTSGATTPTTGNNNTGSLN